MSNNHYPPPSSSGSSSSSNNSSRSNPPYPYQPEQDRYNHGGRAPPYQNYPPYPPMEHRGYQQGYHQGPPSYHQGPPRGYYDAPPSSYQRAPIPQSYYQSYQQSVPQPMEGGDSGRSSSYNEQGNYQRSYRHHDDRHGVKRDYSSSHGNSSNYRGRNDRSYDNNRSSGGSGGYRSNQNKYRKTDKSSPPPLDRTPIKVNDETAPLRNDIPIWNFKDFESSIVYKSNGDEQREKFFANNQRDGTLQNASLAAFIEYNRFKNIQDMRDGYESDVKELLFGLSAPKESLNRWLFEQLSSIDADGDNLLKQQSTSDSLLKRPEFAIESEVLRAEIYSEIPGRLRCRTINQGISSLETYLKNGWDWLKKLNDDNTTVVNSSVYSQIESKLQDLKKWLEMNRGNRSPDYLKQIEEKQKDLTKNCTSLFRDILKSKVDQVCERLVNRAKQVADRLTELRGSLIDEKTGAISCPIVEVKLDFVEREELCKVMYSSTLKEEKSTDSFNLNLVHHNKLRLLYTKYNTERDPEFKHFPHRLYSVIRRYQTFFGNSSTEEGANFHAALPEKGFDFLKKEFNVAFECFASPINCYFNSFCSAFPDTDVYFGSRGSFFEFRPTQGFFECGPPYTLEVMDKSAAYCLELLKASNEPLSFAVFVPEWIDTEYGRTMHPDNTPFCSGHFIAEQGRHEYVIGMQHLKENQQRYWTLPFPTHVYFLQNEAGKKAWPITTETIEKYKHVMEFHK